MRNWERTLIAPGRPSLADGRGGGAIVSVWNDRVLSGSHESVLGDCASTAGGSGDGF